MARGSSDVKVPLEGGILPISLSMKLDMSTPSPRKGDTPLVLLRQPTRQVVRIPQTIYDALDEPRLHDLIIGEISNLSQQGKRLCCPPKLLSDGLVLEWVLDHSAKEEPVALLLSKVGIDANAIQSLLNGKGLGHKSASSHGTKPPVVISLLSDDEDEKLRGFSLASGSTRKDAITIDSDDDDRITANGSRLETPAPSSSSVSLNLKRKISMDHIVPLYNLRVDIQRSQLLATLEKMGVSPSSVSDIRIRTFNQVAQADFIFSSRDDAQKMKRYLDCICNEHNPASQRIAQNQTIVPVPLKTPSEDIDLSPESYEGQSIHAAPEVPDLTRAAGKTDMLQSLYGGLAMPSSDDELSLDEEEHNPRAEQSRRRQLSPAIRNDLVSRVLMGQNYNHLLDPSILMHASLRINDTSRMRSRAESDEDASDEVTQRNHSDSDDDSLYFDEPIQRGVARSSHSTTSGEDSDVQFLSSRAPGPSISESSDDDCPVSSTRRSVQKAAIRRKQGGRLSDDESPFAKDDDDGDTEARVIARPISTFRSSADRDLVQTSLTQPGGWQVALPKPNYARGRRLIVSSDKKLPITAVYMRGDAQFIHPSEFYRISSFSLPEYSEDNWRVADACLLGDSQTIAVGYNTSTASKVTSRPQVSIISMSAQKPCRVNIAHRGHSTVMEHRSLNTSSPNGGISSMAHMQGDRLRFISGGVDGTIRIWTITAEADTYKAKSQDMAVRHRHDVRCVAYRHSDRALLSGAGKHIYLTDIALKTTKAELSTLLLQINIHPQKQDLVFLEVDHLDHQVELYDTRKCNFDRPPSVKFGYREKGRRSLKGHVKGSVAGHYYGRGYGDGFVGIWDIRSTKNVVERFHFEREREQRVTHTVLTAREVIAYGAETVTFWRYR